MKKAILSVMVIAVGLFLHGADTPYGEKLQKASIQLSHLERGGIYGDEAKVIYYPLIQEALSEKNLLEANSKFNSLLFHEKLREVIAGNFYADLFSEFFKKVRGFSPKKKQQAIELCIEFMSKPDIASPVTCQRIISYFSRDLNDPRLYTKEMRRSLLEFMYGQNQFTLSMMKLAEKLQLNDDKKLLERLRESADHFSIGCSDSISNDFRMNALIALARWGEQPYIQKIINEFSKIDSATGYGKNYFLKFRYLYLVRNVQMVEYLRRELHSDQVFYWGNFSCSKVHFAAIVLHMLLEDYPDPGLLSLPFDESRKQECIHWFDARKEYKFREPEIFNPVRYL